MNESLKKDIKEVSREELERLYIEEVEQCEKQINNVYRLKKGFEYLEKYFHDRQDYEYTELIRQVKEANIEWLEKMNELEGSDK